MKKIAKTLARFKKTTYLCIAFEKRSVVNH